jgi:hypothetical protein
MFVNIAGNFLHVSANSAVRSGHSCRQVGSICIAQDLFHGCVMNASPSTVLLQTLHLERSVSSYVFCW